MTDEHFASLRGILMNSPSIEQGKRLYSLLQTWPKEEQTFAVTYAAQHVPHTEEAYTEAFARRLQNPLWALPEPFVGIGQLPSSSVCKAALQSMQEQLLWNADKKTFQIARTCTQELTRKHTAAAKEYALQMQLTSRLQHPHIVQTEKQHVGQQFDAYLLRPTWGPNLRLVLGQLHSMNTPEMLHQRQLISIALLLQITAGLAHAHTLHERESTVQPFVHARLTPENIQLGWDGCAVIHNWGMEWVRKELMYSEPRHAPETYAPEQIFNPAPLQPILEPTIDLFNAGVLLAQLLTSHHPYQGHSEPATLRNLYEGTATRIRQHQPMLLQELEQCVTKAVHKDPKQRYASASEMQQALRTIYASLTSKSPDEVLSSFVQKHFQVEQLMTRYACLIEPHSSKQELFFHWQENPTYKKSTSTFEYLAPPEFILPISPTLQNAMPTYSSYDTSSIPVYLR